MALSTPPTAPQRGDRATFASRVDAFITWLIGFVSELNIFSANMNTLAAGGAYALPYRVRSASSGAVGNGQGGNLAFASNNGILYIDFSDTRGIVNTSLLENITAGASVIKATIRVSKQTDPSVWVMYDITGPIVTDASGLYLTCPTSLVAFSPNTFVDGDDAVVYFQRTGDKGDSGAMTSVLWVRDEKTSGQGGGSAAAVGYTTRTLNTIKKNSVAGASVASNQITLPAGSYRASFSAPAYQTGGHQAYLYNVTDAATVVLGQSMTTGTAIQNRSDAVNSEFTIIASKVLELRHWTNTGTASSGLGFPASTGQNEVYSDVFIEKVS